LFIYITTLSNEDKISYRPSRLIPALILILVLSHLTWSPLSYTGAPRGLVFIFKTTGLSTLVLLTRYLLLTLLTVVKISEGFKGSLLKTK